jgi:hypothetical protein
MRMYGVQVIDNLLNTCVPPHPLFNAVGVAEEMLQKEWGGCRSGINCSTGGGAPCDRCWSRSLPNTPTPRRHCHTLYLSSINPLISPKCVIVLRVPVFWVCLERNAITRLFGGPGRVCDSVEGGASFG